MPQAAAPPPPPAIVASPPAVLPGEGLQLHAGAGFGEYTENAPGLTFEPTGVEPLLKVGGEWSGSLGRGQIGVFGDATVGTKVHMHAFSQGSAVQENDFRQEMGELGARLRWPIGPRVFVEGAYRLTYQRLHFLDVPLPSGPVDADENVTVHALEGGLGWHREYGDGSALLIFGSFGINRGSAVNSVITGGDFSAGGHSLYLRVRWLRASGITFELAYANRMEGGSDQQTVTVMGMQTMAFWPENTTWSLSAFGGYNF